MNFNELLLTFPFFSNYKIFNQNLKTGPISYECLLYTSVMLKSSSKRLLGHTRSRTRLLSKTFQKKKKLFILFNSENEKNKENAREIQRERKIA